MAAVGTLVSRSKAGASFEALVSIVLSGNYPAGGDPFDVTTVVGFINRQPWTVSFTSANSMIYFYDKVNKKIVIRDFPVVNVVGGQGAASAVQINPDSNVGVFGKTAATTRVIPGRTFGFTQVEIPAAAYPADFTGDTILMYAEWFATPQLPT